MTSTPLLPELDPATPFTLRDGQIVDRARFQADVLAVAAALPTDGPVLNMCADRYRFTVALFAAIARGALTVLPSSAAPEHLAMIAAEHPGVTVLGDEAEPPLAGPAYFRVDRVPAGPLDADCPSIPDMQRVACLYTSGSTGTPTRHDKTFGRLRRSALGGAQRLWHAAGGPCSVVATVPVRHMYGLEFTVLMPAFGAGRLAARTPFFPADIADTLAAMPAPRLLVISPFHLQKLIESDIALPDIGAILCATAPLAPALAREAEQRYRCTVIEIYGSTETGQLATRQPAREDLWHTVNDVRLELRDGETWAVGNIYPQAQMLNDMVELLDPTTFRLIDRKANMINIAGKRSSLTLLNAAITRLPGVRDAVFCLPCRGKTGEVERLAAFVVAPELSRETILAGLKTQLDAAFLPRPIIFVDSLPRDGNGKITARALKALIDRHIAVRS
jgi:acyl-coenzyme A synthetase/AMP-(fatty) acid ligase